MNTKNIEGRLNELKGAARKKWGRLTDQDLETWKGRKDELLGKLQQRYGDAKENFEEAVDRLLEKI